MNALEFIYTIEQILKIELLFSWWNFFQDNKIHSFYTPKNGSSFPLYLLFFFFSFRACRIYCKFLYIQDNSHWIPFSCLPGSFLNHTQFSRARITGWYYWQLCWQLYICCPDIQFLIKSVFSIAPCQFWLSLSSQSQFPIPCPIFMPFLIIQVDYNPLLSLIKPRPLPPQLNADQFSGTFLSTGVPADL